MYNGVPSTVNLTYPDAQVGRTPVDVGSTGFFAGQELRFFYEFNIPNGESRWVRATLPVNSTLKAQAGQVDQGFLRFRAWRGATDNGPWSAPASPTSGVFNRNQVAATRMNYTIQSTFEIGGDGAADEDGEVSEIARIKTANATGQIATVGQTITSERGIPAGTYYLQLENLAASGATTGVYYFSLEERSGLLGF